jgi:8-oxo-dGTP pyrophosphatase MutT (NUDIX family)
MVPQYVCAILRCVSTGCLLLEQRPSDARSAAGQVTCFGGKLEAGEEALEGLLRELREELNWQPDEEPRRAVDLFVDGKLIAWFFEAAAPSRDLPLKFEEGRQGVWVPMDELPVLPRLSAWHDVVLQAWRAGSSKADFITAAPPAVAAITQPEHE